MAGPCRIAGDGVSDASRLAPGDTVVGGLGDSGMDHVASVRVRARLGTRPALIEGLHDKVEDGVGFTVHNVGRIGVTVLQQQRLSGRDCGHISPGLATVCRATLDDGVGLRLISTAAGTAVP